MSLKSSLKYILLLIMILAQAGNSLFASGGKDSLYLEYVYAYSTESWEGEEDSYYLNLFQYPQIKGITDPMRSARINSILKEYTEDMMKNLDAGNELKYITKSAYDSIPIPRNYTSCYTGIITWNQDLISFSNSTEWDGGAHPSFSYDGSYSISMKTGEFIRISEILKRRWKAPFMDAVNSSEELKDFGGSESQPDDPCGNIHESVKANVKALSDSSSIVIGDTGLLIISGDYRDYGCPEISRGVFEVWIDHAKIRHLIIKKSFLHRMLQKN